MSNKNKNSVNLPSFETTGFYMVYRYTILRVFIRLSVCLLYYSHRPPQCLPVASLFIVLIFMCIPFFSRLIYCEPRLTMTVHNRLCSLMVCRASSDSDRIIGVKLFALMYRSPSHANAFGNNNAYRGSLPALFPRSSHLLGPHCSGRVVRAHPTGKRSL